MELGFTAQQVLNKSTIILGKQRKAERYFQSWRRQAVEQVILAFQTEKVVEKMLYQDKPYFLWIQDCSFSRACK